VKWYPHCNFMSILLTVGFEVLTAVVMNVAIFWDIALCSPYVYQRLGGTYHLQLQDRKSAGQETSVYNVARLLCFLLGWFSILKMEMIRSSEASVHIRTTRHYIPKYDNIHRCSWWLLKFKVSTFLDWHKCCLLTFGRQFLWIRPWLSGYSAWLLPRLPEFDSRCPCQIRDGHKSSGTDFSLSTSVSPHRQRRRIVWYLLHHFSISPLPFFSCKLPQQHFTL
jgi:hypothetical protein